MRRRVNLSATAGATRRLVPLSGKFLFTANLELHLIANGLPVARAALANFNHREASVHPEPLAFL